MQAAVSVDWKCLWNRGRTRERERGVPYCSRGEDLLQRDYDREGREEDHREETVAQHTRNAANRHTHGAHQV